jgi:hypothetical protein
MSTRKLWNLTVTLGLGMASLLLVFLFVDWNTCGLACKVSATGSTAPLSNLNVCSGVWITETVDGAGNVGSHTSLALEPTYPYTPHISYHDVTSDRLKYARLSGTIWHSETVDSPGGLWTSLALAPAYPYTPCISYHDYWSREQLRHACLSGTGWISTMIGRQRAGLNGTSLALEPTYPYTPHISYYYPSDGSQHLGHTYLSGTTWCSGAWMIEAVERGPVGMWSSLALEPTCPYTPHISYWDSVNKDLKYAWLSGTTWVSQTVDSTGDVGWYTSLALDDSGDPHISYFDNTNGVLKYAWLSGSTWITDTVGSAGGLQYGWGTSLALDRANRPYISYYDDHDLKFARFDGNVWITEIVDSRGDVGAFSSLALDRYGCPHISYYDATDGALKYAYVPPMKIYLPFVTKAWPGAQYGSGRGWRAERQ